MSFDWFISVDDLPQDVQHKITVGNACRVYDFAPAEPPERAS